MLTHSSLNYWLNPQNDTTAYRYFRFRHNASSLCQLASLAFHGVLLHNRSNSNTYSCNITIAGYNQSLVL